jgi:hypothetical protein
MLSRVGESETEFEAEFESELEAEGEFEFEGEFEGEGEFEAEGELESEFEGEFESELEAQGEGEFEFESEFEGPNPVSKVYPDAMMEHMGLAAMESQTESEAAEHFLPLIPLVASKLLPIAAKGIAKHVLPRVAKAVTRATPTLTRGVTALTKKLHLNPQTRHLLRTIPSTARRAVATLARHAAKGHQVTPRQAVKILARENRRVLGNPRIRHAVLRRAGAMDRKMHRLHGRHLPHRYGHGVRRWYGGPWRLGYGPRHHLQGRGYVQGVGHPVYGARTAYGPVAPRVGGCPTCGTGARPGVRRVCCCC